MVWAVKTGFRVATTIDPLMEMIFDFFTTRQIPLSLHSPFWYATRYIVI